MQTRECRITKTARKGARCLIFLVPHEGGCASKRRNIGNKMRLRERFPYIVVEIERAEIERKREKDGGKREVKTKHESSWIYTNV